MVRKEDRTFQEYSAYKLGDETIALSWHPFRNMTPPLEKECGRYVNTRGHAALPVREQSVRSIGFSGAGAWHTSDGRAFNLTSLPAADRSSANAAARRILIAA